jgi:hypothetical protein
MTGRSPEAQAILDDMARFRRWLRDRDRFAEARTVEACMARIRVVVPAKAHDEGQSSGEVRKTLSARSSASVS